MDFIKNLINSADALTKLSLPLANPLSTNHGNIQKWNILKRQTIKTFIKTPQKFITKPTIFLAGMTTHRKHFCSPEENLLYSRTTGWEIVLLS